MELTQRLGTSILVIYHPYGVVFFVSSVFTTFLVTFLRLTYEAEVWKVSTIILIYVFHDKLV